MAFNLFLMSITLKLILTHFMQQQRMVYKMFYQKRIVPFLWKYNDPSLRLFAFIIFPGIYQQSSINN